MSSLKLAWGIESSANKIGIGILDINGNILSNPRKTFITPPGTGFMPKETADHHRKLVLELIDNALKHAKITIKDIKLICYTKGPGMGPPLQVAVIVARTLSLIHNIPIIGVNHCIAHIEMGILSSGLTNPIILYVSGGNTQIIAYNYNRYRIFGETIDLAVGNLLDKFARWINLSNDPSPGYNIEKMAEKGKKFIELPYTVKGMDLSFSGLLGFAEDLILSHPKYYEEIIELENNIDSNSFKRKKYSKKKNITNKSLKDPDWTKEDLCYSLQEIIFCMLAEVTERAMSHFDTNDVIIVGGVGCNLRLQKIISDMVKSRNGNMGAMDERYCVDNGAMIAYLGLLMNKNNFFTPINESTITQYFRTDDVFVDWK